MGWTKLCQIMTSQMTGDRLISISNESAMINVTIIATFSLVKCLPHARHLPRYCTCLVAFDSHSTIVGWLDVICPHVTGETQSVQQSTCLSSLAAKPARALGSASFQADGERLSIWKSGFTHRAPRQWQYRG